MAYAAAISLKHTIERILKSSDSLAPRSLEIVRFAYKGVEFLEVFLKLLHSKSDSRSKRRRVDALDGEIREAVYNLEDVVESHLSNQIVSQSESFGDESHPLIDLQDLEQDIYHFAKFLTNLKEYLDELSNPMPEDEEDEAVFPRIDFCGRKSKLVGSSDQLREIKGQLTQFSSFPFQVISLVGMAGIGKTTLAMEIFEDPVILECFDRRAFVIVGRECQLKEIPRLILAQMCPDICTDKMRMEGDEKIAQFLCKRCLIVLDDVWDKKVWDYLQRFIPNNKSGCRVLLTTRLEEVAQEGDQYYILKMRLMNIEESWGLLREKVFAERLCPPELENAGKKIAEKCDGLPLTIVTVADLLSKAEKSPQYWREVAEQKNHQLFMAAYNEISKVLLSSYEYLPQQLKPCFISLGVFPQNYEIPQTKLISMWIAEGLLDRNVLETSKNYALKCLQKLVSQSLVMVYRQSTISKEIKTCGLHSSLWHLCNKEARKNKFFHVLDSRSDGLAEGIKRQRQLCIHNNLLFSIKDVHKSMEDNCAFTSRSLLCYGPYHQYPVPICFGLRLLRVLDALSIHFYEFPIQVLKLIQLAYLALTYDGRLPASISKLSNLQYLIVRQHQSIKYCQVPAYLPMEIWDMKELKHIQVMGSDLPDCSGALLLNLLTIFDVSVQSCTKGVFTGIPNVRKLGIRIELVPHHEPLHCFDDISRLYRLESLTCVIVNPNLRSEVVASPTPLIFPSGLIKLTLSGLGYHWDHMSTIGSLPKLEVLKLQWYAFRGPMWEIEENRFLELKFLLMEDSDLVEWKVGSGSFPKLEYLSIRRCYKLEELHWIRSDGHVPHIEIVECNLAGVKQIETDKSRKGYDLLPDVRVQSS